MLKSNQFSYKRLLVNCIYSLVIFNTMKQTLHLLLFGLISIILFSAVPSKTNPLSPQGISIEQLLNENKIEVLIKGKGGHKGECVSFDLKNLTEDTLFVLLESGRRLVSGDSSNQDIFIVKSKTICLTPHQQKLDSGFGFCCQSSNSSPQLDDDFSIGQMAPEEWQKLAKVIDANDFPIGAIQSAVWCISNDHPISSIHSDDMEGIQLLRRTVAEIKLKELPWYYMTYHEDTSVVFSNKYKNIIGNIEFNVQSNAIITINVRNKHGQIVATLIKESSVGVGKHKYSMNLSVSRWPKGDYTIYVYEDYSRLNSKKTFEL